MYNVENLQCLKKTSKNCFFLFVIFLDLIFFLSLGRRPRIIICQSKKELQPARRCWAILVIKFSLKSN